MTEFESISPNTGRSFARWIEISAEAAQARIERIAGASFALADLTARKDILFRVSAALSSARSELVALTVTEVGKTWAEAEAEIDYAESFLEASRRLLDAYPFETPLSAGRTVREVPRGAGLLIAPFNDPVAGLTRKIGPCLAAGAGALVKPSELAVQVALVFERYLSQQGLDKYIAMLPIADRGQIAALVADPQVGTVSFTGSTVAGRSLAVEAARCGKGFVGELGGTNPFVILADADLDRAVSDLVTRKLKAAGQACSAPNLVLADGAVASEVADRIDATFRRARAGPSTDDDIALGPVRSAEAVDRLSRQAAALEARGARRLGHGIAPPRRGISFLAQPTAHVFKTPDAFLEQEMFGPLMGVVPVADRSVLAEILGTNRHPLVLYVYGAHTEAITDLTSSLRYGSIGVNTTSIQSPDAPTGGFADAGIGREGGAWGLREFLTTINLRNGGP